MANGSVDTASIVNVLKQIAQELAYIRAALQKSDLRALPVTRSIVYPLSVSNA